MKKKIIFLSFVLLFTLVVISTVNFFNKRNIPFKLVLESTDPLDQNWEFHPGSSKFIHGEDDLKKMIPEIRLLLTKMNLDFEKHSYLLVYRKKIHAMHYSPYCAVFQNITPRKFRIKGKKYVCIEYENLSQNNIYLYEVDNDKKLSGCTDQG
jgi:hypothetical protein